MEFKNQDISQCICKSKRELSHHKNIYHALYHGCLYCINKTEGKLRLGVYWNHCDSCLFDPNDGCHVERYLPNIPNIYMDTYPVCANMIKKYIQKFLDSSADISHKFQFLLIFHKITKQNFWVLDFKHITSLNRQQLLQLIDINSIPCNQFWQPFKYKCMPVVLQVYINIRKSRPYKRNKKYRTRIQYIKDLVKSYIDMKVSLLILQRAVKLHPDTAKYVEKFIEI